MNSDSTYRLPKVDHEWIDRERPISFQFEGREYTGFVGDSISSALWGNGLRMLGRSFKYHRPRGVYSMSGHDANVMVATADRPNMRGDTTLLEDGMVLNAVNTVGGLQSDLVKHTDRFSKFLPVGFYYKAFHTPAWLFPAHERIIRDIAGLGSVNPDAKPVPSPKRYDSCDVLVIGAGPSGISAAIAAAKAGAKVVLVDETRCLGGSLCFAGAALADAESTIHNLTSELSELDNVDVRLDTCVRGCYADNWVALVDGDRLTKMRTCQIVVATGVYEQPAVFRHNDLPGVMLGTGAQRLLHLYRVKPMERAVVVVGNDYGYGVALDLHEAGVIVAAIADLRTSNDDSELGQAAAAAGIKIMQGHGVYEASPTAGLCGIKAAQVCPVNAEGVAMTGSVTSIPCDGIVMAVGWAPASDVIGHAGGRLAYSKDRAQFRPDKLPDNMFAAGRVNGLFGLDARLDDGTNAGALAAAAAAGEALPSRRRPDDSVSAPSHPYPIVTHPEGKVFVDLDEDVQYKDIVNGAREGFDSAELLKRYTTVGMGPSQGKISNLNAARVLSKTTGEPLADIGYTTFRPFTRSTTIGTLAGRNYHPERLTPMHARHVAAGAEFMPAGSWLRPAYYGPRGRREAIAREVRTVRQSAGLVDVSTLGKIDICGSDAAEFLERMYTGRFSDLAIGRCRYAMMCDDTAVVIDDGMAVRLSDDRFYITTTTSGAAAIVREMKRWVIIWKLNVIVIDQTGQLAAMNLAGPKSREILSSLTDLPLSGDDFPYLHYREALVAGVPCRLLRVGFVGELGYELHAPAQHAATLWDAVIDAGAAHGIRPFGVEAQRMLRLEKGHQIIGQDTDGLSNPFEAGLGWAVKMDKKFFLGQRSLAILQKQTVTRALVGFTLPDCRWMPEECHLVIDHGDIAGRVTSISVSPTLDCAIGMAYVRPDQAEPGTIFSIRIDGGKLIEAEVVKLPFYDPGNGRQKL